MATPAPARQRRGSGGVNSRGAARRSQAAWSSSRAGLSNLPPTTGLESTQESGRPNGLAEEALPDDELGSPQCSLRLLRSQLPGHRAQLWGGGLGHWHDRS